MSHDPITELLMKSPWPLSIAEIAETTRLDDTTVVLVIRLMSQNELVKQFTDGRWILSAREDEIVRRLELSKGSQFTVSIPFTRPSIRVDQLLAHDTEDSTPETASPRRRLPRPPTHR